MNARAGTQGARAAVPGLGGSGAFARWLAQHAAFGSSRRRIRFYDKMGRFTRNGVPLVTALRNMQRRYARAKDVRAGLFAALLLRLEDGEPLSRALGGRVPAAERLLIQSGEESGRLHEGFFEARRLAEATAALRGALVAELSYPAILFAVLGALLAMIALKLVPVLTAAVPLAGWPPFSKGLYVLSRAVLTGGLPTLIVLVALTTLAIRSLPTWRGPLRERLDRRLPPWSIYREVQGSGFLIALAAMAGAGQPVSTAVERLGAHGSPWLTVHMKRMLRTLMTGANPGEAMRTGLFDREVEDDIEDYSAIANFEDALARVGADQVQDAIGRIRRRAAAARYLMMALVTATILYVYGSAAMVAVSVATQARHAVPGG